MCRWGSTTVAEVVGKNCRDELICRPMCRSDSGDDDTSSDVPLHSLRRDPNDGGPPGPCHSFDNKTASNQNLLSLIINPYQSPSLSFDHYLQGPLGVPCQWLPPKTPPPPTRVGNNQKTRQTNIPITTRLAGELRRQALPHSLFQDRPVPEGGSRRRRRRG